VGRGERVSIEQGGELGLGLDSRLISVISQILKLNRQKLGKAETDGYHGNVDVNQNLIQDCL